MTEIDGWESILSNIVSNIQCATNFDACTQIFRSLVRSYLAQPKFDDAMAKFGLHFGKTVVTSPNFADHPRQSILDVYIDDLERDAIVVAQGNRTLSTKFRIQLLSDLLHGIGPSHDREQVYYRQTLRVQSILVDLYKADGDSRHSSHYHDIVKKRLEKEERISHSIDALESALETNSRDAVLREIRVIKSSYPIINKVLHAKFLRLLAREGVSQRDLLEAKAAFADLSSHDEVPPDEQIQALTMAVVCELLNPDVCKGRSGIQSHRDKDARVQNLDIYDVIAIICDGKMLTLGQIDKIRNVVPSTFLTSASTTNFGRDQKSVFDTAMFGYQLNAISQIYENISFARLAILTTNSIEDVQEYTGLLLIGGTDPWARVDQVGEMVRFPKRSSCISLSSSLSSSSTSHWRYAAIRYWDRKILSLNTEVERLAETVLLQQEGSA